jgi:hypothetical protein
MLAVLNDRRLAEGDDAANDDRSLPRELLDREREDLTDRSQGFLAGGVGARVRRCDWSDRERDACHHVGQQKQGSLGRRHGFFQSWRV